MNNAGSLQPVTETKHISQQSHPNQASGASIIASVLIFVNRFLNLLILVLFKCQSPATAQCCNGGMSLNIQCFPKWQHWRAVKFTLVPLIVC